MSNDFLVASQDELVNLNPPELSAISSHVDQLSAQPPPSNSQSTPLEKFDFDLDPQQTPAGLVLSRHSHNSSERALQYIIRAHLSNTSDIHLDTLTQSVQSLISAHQNGPLNNRSLDKISNELLDLLGFESIELVHDILQSLPHLPTSQDDLPNKPINQKSSKATPIPDDDLNGPFDIDQLNRIKARKLIDATKRPLFSREGFLSDQPVNPHIFTASASHSSLYPSISASGQKYALPSGTTRASHEVFEEITIPPAAKIPMRDNEALINISDLDPISRSSFPGYKTLNRLQSAVYPIAYKTNENMLVCAPTGAGKTDVAMLTILRAISQYGGLNLERPTKGLRTDFKVVYVAPMKALAAEIVRKMGKRLSWLGMVVKELTGDMQLTREEISATHLIVTTPEKWDVVTRKASGEEGLVSMVRLLIIDEVHLLHEDRGAVIETIVARTLRQVESSQSLIRIVGLSATLPNYTDVSDFLRVNQMQGLFYFDSSFRPVPLEQHFIGVKGKPNTATSRANLDKAAFKKVSELVKEGHQVMVFVHARKETVKTAEMLRERAMEEGILELFDPAEHPKYDSFKRELTGSRNREMKDLVQDGFGIHHAGMLRSDRNISEKLFETGVTRVLCCTATLAWGVNLPAYAVVIKGTQIYDASKGSFVDLGILDVLQIFGRAGRPQYEDHGVGYICTTHDRLDHYVAAITQQHPIESQFIAGIVDSLNAEIALGTVRTIDEGVQWIGWTYLFVRMRKNPMVYGLTISDVEDDPLLGNKRHSLIEIAAKKLHQIGMVVFDELTGALEPTELGRIASKYYIKHASIEIFNQLFRPKMTEADVLAMLSQSVEFDQIKVRDSELDELERLQEQAPCQVKGGPTSTAGKVSILLQAHVSRAYVDDFALVSDTAYVAQNAARIARALVEIGVWKKLAETSRVLIEIGKCIDKRIWPFVHPLIQSGLSDQLMYDLDQRAGDVEIEDLAEMSASEVGVLCRLNERLGGVILQAARQFPRLSIEYSLQPLSEELLRVRIHAKQEFDWSVQAHGRGEPFWIWVEDGDQREILRIARVYLRQSTPKFDLDLVIPFWNGSRPLPDLVGIRVVSDRWVGADSLKEVQLTGLVLCPSPPERTKLLELPLLSASKMALFNENGDVTGLPSQLGPAETQCFHAISHTPHDVLVCSPERQVGVSLAICAIARTLRLASGKAKQVVVIAPKKAIARQMVDTFSQALKSFPVKFKTSFEPSQAAQYQSYQTKDTEVVVMTPKVGLSLLSSFTKDIALTIVIDPHDLNPDYERLVSKIVRNWWTTRLLCFSTSLIDPRSLTRWLRIDPQHVFNFSPLSRAEPVSVEVQAFKLPYSSTQWKAMVRPVWKTIEGVAPLSVAVFVPLRHQCRPVAKLLAQCSATSNGQESRGGSDEEERWMYGEQFADPELADVVVHGIITLEERMSPREVALAVDLFRRRTVRVMVLARESCWRVSSAQVKAETVVVMGTQYGLGRQAEREDDLPSRLVGEVELSELVQMQSFVGEHAAAGAERRKEGVAEKRFVVMCEEEQLERYDTFLKSGLPLESTINVDAPDYLDDVLAELCRDGRTGKRARSELMVCLSDTFLYERVCANPMYYDLDIQHGRGEEAETEETEDQRDAWAASAIVDQWVAGLVERGCVRALGAMEIEVTEIGRALVADQISVAELDRLRVRLVEQSRTTTVIEGGLSVQKGLVGRTKVFYGKLPRHLKDTVPMVVEDDSQADEQEQADKLGKEDEWVKNVLVECFKAGRVPFLDSVLAEEQARLVVEMVKKNV